MKQQFTFLIPDLERFAPIEEEKIRAIKRKYLFSYPIEYKIDKNPD